MTGAEEIRLDEDDLIVSKTDPKGRITYANRRFMEIAGYSEPQLLGKPHNLIRHPEMPRGVFRFMWATLQAGQEFFGYVKNRTSDGGYYWVFANVTPDYTANSQLAGYFSVRRRPNRAAIQQVSHWYRQMRAIESQQSASKAPEASMQWLLDQVAAQGCTYNELVRQLESLPE
ncbi:PAS domain-containing protein [Marinospirillum alkaliphilum]|uniref:Aerotaxis receptor n=1 Tax=Marinospirillum alkaliphilum DSM 21637 TaxID=1122209 RepID=A0A1K1WUJ9_9GAMM|nr:PAS domain-containing protein [Marinospirillum alkaliphilum]SFX40644.1 aerotaxis receptor [Marinospirillum alkaliphilum DSM 21637]